MNLLYELIENFFDIAAGVTDQIKPPSQSPTDKSVQASLLHKLNCAQILSIEKLYFCCHVWEI